jgi:DNA-binding response OmpR family regulator
MNDYIAKPVDERLLYNKIVSLIRKSSTKKSNEIKTRDIPKKKKIST